jgi:hypothetical protein
MLAHLKGVAHQQIGEYWITSTGATSKTTGTPTRGAPAGS